MRSAPPTQLPTRLEVDDTAGAGNKTGADPPACIPGCEKQRRTPWAWNSSNTAEKCATAARNRRNSDRQRWHCQQVERKILLGLNKDTKSDKAGEKCEGPEGGNRGPEQPNYRRETRGYCGAIFVMDCMPRGAQHLGWSGTTNAFEIFSKF